jgi:type VI secretion system protein ImpA
LQGFLLGAEGLLPESYRDFNKKTFESKGTLQKIEGYLAKTRDLRLLVLAAKYCVLSDDLKGFASSISAMARLLGSRWEHCHPAAASGGNALRSAHVKSLDDMPTSILPMQSVTLITDKRVGAISIRSILLARKEVAPRSEEPVLDSETIKDAFGRVEPVERLVALANELDGITGSLKAIRQVFIDNAGYDDAPQFVQLPALVQTARDYLAGIIAERTPADLVAEPKDTGLEDGAAQADSEGAGNATLPDIASVKEASNALDAILLYYAANEPSSPARLLTKQARQLVGKSFIEAMRILAPGMAGEAKIKIGGEAPFALDFSQLAELAGDDRSQDEDDTQARAFVAPSRSEATSLMRRIEQFYKRTEPSSPIPLLIEQARNFVAKDFNSLLREMMKKEE